jgi:hypothetical protein
MKLTEGTLLTRARTLAAAVTLVAALYCLIMPTASAQNADSVASTLSTGFMFTEASGEAPYANVCQDCHMLQLALTAGEATISNLHAGFYLV